MLNDERRMSVVTPKVGLGQDHLGDLLSAPMIRSAAERARDGHWLIGEELVFECRLTLGDGKSDEFAADTIDSDIHRADLPPHSRHRPIESGNFYHVKRHYGCPKSIKNLGFPMEDVKY
jgi:hypothetical protein